MKKYQIVEIEGNHQHAGTKATADVRKIAEDLEFKSVYVKMNNLEDSKLGKIKRQIGYYHDWNKVYKTIEKNSIVLLQHPFHNRQLTREKKLGQLKKEKKVKYISLIHDIEKLRKFRYNDYYAHEFEFMKNIADVVICHNEVMKRYLVEEGLDSTKIVVLEIFDYLQNKKAEKPMFKTSITVAGNLDTEKCGYIGELSKLEDIDINLYGPNFNENQKKYKNIHYHGSFPPDEVPNHLTSGFGLVWDGSSIDGCIGDSGQYLKYNNPHKLSLYLSSGLPVVLWKGAAEAKFVEKYKVGICVYSLKELSDVFSNMTEKDYDVLAQNALDLSVKLKNGIFAKSAILEAEKVI